MLDELFREVLGEEVHNNRVDGEAMEEKQSGKMRDTIKKGRIKGGRGEHTTTEGRRGDREVENHKLAKIRKWIARAYAVLKEDRPSEKLTTKVMKK